MISSIRPQSATVRVIGLMLETLANSSGDMSCGISPADALKPMTPLQAAGIRVEPPATVATAKGPTPAAMATAAPPDEPPQVRSALQTLRVRPNSGASV